ncbi:hypothetical protein ACILE2_10845 [Capnocytophaga canimorsus]|uniref:hypothetical protein n=1 Tax=Capnocytophaga canimorsus TaxID=28188 RepID=UPI0037D4F005
MKLKEGEAILDEYYFKSDNKKQEIKSILTDNRLVFITQFKGNYTEENYPLSKITSVRIEKNRSYFRSKVLGFAVVISVIVVIFSFSSIMNSGDFIEAIVPLLPIYIVLALLIMYGLKPDKIITSLIITQFGGTKRYIVQHNDKIANFVDKINNKIS